MVSLLVSPAKNLGYDTGMCDQGTSPKIKDMTNFDYTQGKTYETGDQATIWSVS